MREETLPRAALSEREWLSRLALWTKGGRWECARRPAREDYFFFGGTTASLNALASRNLTTVLAGILMGSPV